MSPSPENSKLASIQPSAASSPNPKAERPKFLLSVNGASDSSEPSSPPDPSKSSQCSSLSDGESFECFGESDHMSSTLDGHNNSSSGTVVGVDLDLAPQFHHHNDGEKNSISRNTWARTSLRGLRGSMKRPLGSNVLANHLYRSSSFNSSGRSSNCDTTEDMFSDVSLEDVQDLNHKLELLQRQVTNLADTQMNTEDRTTRAKTDYAVLQAKYHMLEEQLRETEMRGDERLVEEQKRYRELLARVEREAELKNENCQIRIQTMESETTALKEEIQRLRIHCDKQTAELAQSEEKYESARFNLSVAQENLAETRAHEKRFLADKNHSEQLIMELTREIERIRTEAQAVMVSVRKSNFHNISASSLSLESNGSSEPFRIDELQNEVEELKQQNRQLQEANEELQAMLLNKNIEEGRNLLNGGTFNLADELKEMGQSQDDALLNSITQLQDAYQDKDDECRRLKRYIDTILLNIVENHPQLLEIKSSSSN